MTKIVRSSFLLVGAVIIFILGILVGSTLYGPKKDSYVMYSSPSKTDTKSNIVLNSNTKLNSDIELNLDTKSSSIKEEALKSFSFAYNTTHLWSMRVADKSYYDIGRLLPCRSVSYVGGPINETMDSCNQSTLDEFSVEASVHAQKWLYEHQHPADCTNKKFAILHQFAWSGFGSTVHQIVWALGVALAEDRIAVYETPGNWLYGNCQLGTPDCVFLPISNCSIPSKVDGKQTIRVAADFGHWAKPIHPPVFQNRSFNWYRSQLLFYLMRYNPTTLTHVQDAVARYFNPPSVDLHRPYAAVYIRRSDKVKNREMSQAYPLQQYFDLFDADARRAKINTVYINSEDEKVFGEFDQVNKNKENYYKLLSINATRDVVFMSLIATASEQRKKIVLEFLTDLFIEANADLHAGTLTSNWCRLVDEMRLVLGKMIPYYTPENRFLVDM